MASLLPSLRALIWLTRLISLRWPGWSGLRYIRLLELEVPLRWLLSPILLLLLVRHGWFRDLKERILLSLTVSLTGRLA